MDYSAVIIANKTSQGLSVIDIAVYDRDRRLLARPTKSLIDRLNAIPFLDPEKLKLAVAKQYGIPVKYVSIAR